MKKFRLSFLIVAVLMLICVNGLNANSKTYLYTGGSKNILGGVLYATTAFGNSYIQGGIKIIDRTIGGYATARAGSVTDPVNQYGPGEKWTKIIENVTNPSKTFYVEGYSTYYMR